MQLVDGDIREDRYSRLRLIPWWDQAKIAACNLLVVGAGALGNEILKNAALLGFRNVIVVDMDRIEVSNLSRTILYREQDIGEFKAVVAAKAYQALAPDAKARPLVANQHEESFERPGCQVGGAELPSPADRPAPRCASV